ncbi:MAG: glycosyltransferase family 2 protein [Planctomycetota bacterium]
MSDPGENGQPPTPDAPTPGSVRPAHNVVDVSIVVPIYNEEESVPQLVAQVQAVMDAGAYRYEAIFISDGSYDQTVQRLREASAGDARITIVQLMRNFGQTAAMAAGFDQARGEVIVPMDGDLQNDPADIPRLVGKLDEYGAQPGAWDIVSGWRKNRQDKLWSRRFPSIIANKVIKKLTWTGEIHDFGCSLKAYRAIVLKDVHIYGEMHRFLPAICKWRGARVTEEVVNHRAREFGSSKYNLKRTIKVLLDLLTVKFLGDYLAKPIYFFGKFAGLAFLITFLLMILVVLQKFGILTEHDGPIRLNNNVFVTIGVFTALTGIMLLMMGVLSELITRIYHESQNRAAYKVRAWFGGADAPGSGLPTPVGSDHTPPPGARPSGPAEPVPMGAPDTPPA